VRAVVIDSPGATAAVRSVDDPSPGPDELVVAVRGCGICGTDRHILDEGLPTARYPLVPGHEPWGEVVAVGAGAAGPATGALVAVDPSLHCGRCDRCRRGQGNMCERWGAIGGTEPGAWAEYVAVPAANAHVLPDGFPLDCASIVEPVACALRGMQQLRPEPGRSALVVGGGTMGLIIAILLELRGVGPLTVVEANPRRRELDRRVLGAEVLAPDEVGDREADYVVDATGVPAAVEDALRRVAPNGTFMVFGVSAPDATVRFSPFEIYRREITVVGSMAILRTFAPAVETVARHAARFRPLLTHRFDLERFEDAVRTMSSGDAIKVTIEPAA
jgi:2-desacetyl-2-hydroxyethyl bacteriochlorophyllide A dehydrogenase